ncbi:hypothetical protein [Paenibacillus illinoisensis]|uniref:hypothetical protein n=1 Tax=Paenibacillus illinoisensis TaxID=59845 RepID=UPI0030164435
MLNILTWFALAFVLLSNTYLMIDERKKGKPILARVVTQVFCIVVIIIGIIDGGKL